MNLNKVMLAGNLVRDPEIRYTPKGLAIAKFSLAVNRAIGGEDKRNEVTYVDVDCFGKTAEFVGKSFGKGKNVFLEGRLQFQMWDDRTTGQKKTKLSVIADTVLATAPASYNQAPGAAPSAEAPAPAAPAAAATPVEADGPPEGDDVPF